MNHASAIALVSLLAACGGLPFGSANPSEPDLDVGPALGAIERPDASAAADRASFRPLDGERASWLDLDASPRDATIDSPIDSPADVFIDTCRDGIVSGNESDVDCGGATICPRCAAGKFCSDGSDCASNHCAGVGDASRATCWP